MARKRPTIPRDTELQLLTRCRRRCALCFGLNFDATYKKGQRTHLDHNPENNELDNLAYLCQEHHEEYDSTPSVTKGITEQEVRKYRGELEAFVEAWPVSRARRAGRRRPAKRTAGDNQVRLQLLDRRLKMYETVKTFVGSVVREAKISFQDVGHFARDTDQAVFLFDDELVEALAEIYRRAVKLHITHEQVFNPGAIPPPNRSELVGEIANLLVWFTEQIPHIRRLCAAQARVVD